MKNTRSLNEEGIREATGNRRLRRVWANFLKEFEWDHVGHLTFRYTSCSIDLALKRFEDWANGLCRLTQGPVHWVAFPERTYDGLYHLHVLICGTRDIDVRRMRNRWRLRNGYQLKIEPYVQAFGIEHYAVKWISVRYSECRFSKTLKLRALGSVTNSDGSRPQ